MKSNLNEFESQNSNEEPAILNNKSKKGFGNVETEKLLYKIHKNLIDIHNSTNVESDLLSGMNRQSESLSKIMENLNKILCDNKLTFDFEKFNAEKISNSSTIDILKKRNSALTQIEENQINSDKSIPNSKPINIKYPISIQSMKINDPTYLEITKKNIGNENIEKEKNTNSCLSEQVFTLLNQNKQKLKKNK